MGQYSAAMLRRALVLVGLLLACRKAPVAVDASVDRPIVPDVVDMVIAPEDVTDAPATRPRRATITLGGDILLSARVVQEALSRRENGRLVALLGPIAPLMAFQTIAFANLRTPLGAPATLAAANSSGAPTDLARDLARVGFDVLQVANDHAGDLGARGLRDTLDALRAARVIPSGVSDGDDGPLAPAVVERDGVRVAFLSCTTRLLRDPGEPRGEHEPRVARLLDDPTALLGAITAARSVADVVVVGVHWSRERNAAVTEGQRALARQMIDAGADVIAGFGQPTLGAVTRTTSPRGEAVIAWSLGTLVSHYGAAWHLGTPAAQIARSPWVYDPAYRDGVMLHVSFDLSAPPAVRVSRLSANAIWTSHLEDEIRVVPMRGVDERVSTERMRAIGAALGSAVRLRP